MKALTILIASLMWQVPAYAANAPWMTDRFDVVVKQQDLREVLTEFAGAVGAPLKLSEAVDGVATATFEDATARDVLDQLARNHAFDWRFDGRRLEITAQEEQVSRVLGMGGVDKDRLVAALSAVDAYDDRFPLAVTAGDIGVISGPPAYVAMLEVVLSGLREKRRVEVAEEMARDAAQAEKAEQDAQRAVKAAESRRAEREALEAKQAERLAAQEREREERLAKLEREREERRIAQEREEQERREARRQLDIELQREALLRQRETEKLRLQHELEMQRMAMEMEARRQEREHERLRELERIRLMRALQGPVVIRNGRWGS